MTWNHRVVRHTDGVLEIAEVYYEDDGSLMGYSDATVFASPDEDQMGSLYQQLGWFADALGKPILDVRDFEKGDTPDN